MRAAIPALAVLLVLGTAAEAGTLFDNGLPTSLTEGTYADADTPQLVAENFALLDTSKVTGVKFWGGYYAGDGSFTGNDDFTLTIWADSSGKPGSVVASIGLGHVGRTDTLSDTPLGMDIFSYDASFSGVTLPAAVDYWISIQNSTPSDTDNWVWSRVTASGTFAVSTNGGTTWSTGTGTTLAFALTGEVVPLPNSAWLGLGLLAVLGVVRFSRRRRFAA